MQAIHTRNLTKYYGQTKGIVDLNLEVRRGEIFGFIGPNGAGKSTTIRLMMQLLHPTSGEIKLLGQRVCGDQPTLRRRIGYLPSEIQFYESLTGAQVLQLIAQVYAKPLQRPIAALADDLALDLTKRVKSYSLGNRKKLGIVQALMHDPELIILDEPTSGLDPLIRSSFFAMLRERREQGATIFFSTHVLTEVEELCDRVGIVRDGELFQVSGVSEVPGRDRRILKVKFAQPGNMIEAFGLAAIDPDVTFDGEKHQFRITGEMNPVLQQLLQHPILDLNVESPSLEQIFMDVYNQRVQR